MYDAVSESALIEELKVGAHRGRAARELADDLVDLLADALQVTPTQIRQAYQRSRRATTGFTA